MGDVTTNLAPTFVWDHLHRLYDQSDSDTAVWTHHDGGGRIIVVRERRTYVRLTMNNAASDELLSDADFYADEESLDDDYRSVARSARAVAVRLRAALAATDPHRDAGSTRTR